MSNAFSNLAASLELRSTAAERDSRSGLKQWLRDDHEFHLVKAEKCCFLRKQPESKGDIHEQTFMENRIRDQLALDQNKTTRKGNLFKNEKEEALKSMNLYQLRERHSVMSKHIVLVAMTT